MKKKIFGMLGALFATALCAAAFTACDKGTGGDDGNNQTAFTITFTDTEDYTLTIKNGSGDDAETITSDTAVEAGTYIYVTAETTSYATYISEVYYNGTSCSTSSGQYYFKMPEQDVKITAETAEYVQTLKDSRAEFTNTDTTITKGGTNTGSSSKKIWEFTVALSWSQYGSLTDDSKVTSSNQTVIPDDAITLDGDISYETHIKNEGKATITIDTSMIDVGSTYLTIYLNNTNTALSSTNRSTLYILVHVDEGEKLQVWTETVTIDFSGYANEGDDVYVQFSDTNYISGSTINGKEATQTISFTTTVGDDGKATFTFDYVIGHSYTIIVCLGTEFVSQWNAPEKVLKLADTLVGNGATWVTTETTHYLSFTAENSTITLTVSGTEASS